MTHTKIPWLSRPGKWNHKIPWLSRFSMTCTNPVTKMRLQLILGKVHNYFVVPQRSIHNKLVFSLYSASFEKHFSMKVSTYSLRKAVLNYFLSLPGASDFALRKSLAAVVKHSLRTQKCFFTMKDRQLKRRWGLSIFKVLLKPNFRIWYFCIIIKF